MFDRFAIAEAYYWWYSHHHEGMHSRGYERLCKISSYFRPSPLANGPSDDIAVEIYENLCHKNGCNHN